MNQILFLTLIATIVLPFAIFYFGERNKSRFKNTLIVNISSFFAVLLLGIIFNFSNIHAESTVATVTVSDISKFGLAFLAAGLSTGLSCVGAGIAVSSAASAALGALSENEGIMGKAMIFVALAEGVAIYGLIISIMILGRIPQIA